MKNLLLVLSILACLFIALLILIVAGGTYVASTQMKEWARTDPQGYAAAMERQEQERIEDSAQKRERERRRAVAGEQEHRKAEEAEQAEPVSSRWTLTSTDGALVSVGATKEVYARFIKLAVAGDLYGIQQLKLAGLVYQVPSGTPVIRLGGLITCEVRILSGEHAGELAWVDTTLMKQN